MPKKGQTSKSVPKVLKVKDEAPSQKFDDIHPHLPAMPSLLLIVGSVRSGKSNYLVNCFCNSDFYKDKFDVVKFISTTLHTDNKGKILSKYFDCMDHYEDGIIEDIKKMQSGYENKEDCTIDKLLKNKVKGVIFPSGNEVSGNNYNDIFKKLKKDEKVTYDISVLGSHDIM